MQLGPEIESPTLPAETSQETSAVDTKPEANDQLEANSTSIENVDDSKELADLLAKFKELGLEMQTTVKKQGWLGKYNEKKPTPELLKEAKELDSELSNIAQANVSFILPKSKQTVEQIRKETRAEDADKGVVTTFKESEKGGLPFQRDLFAKEWLKGYNQAQLKQAEIARREAAQNFERYMKLTSEPVMEETREEKREGKRAVI